LIVKYHVVRYGQPALPPILFLHGFLGSSADFWPLLTPLAEHFHCICVDLPGHGQTRENPPLQKGELEYEPQTLLGYEIQDIARSLIELLESLEIDRPCGLVGYSFGGRIALYLALQYPQYWHQVVLESASAGLAHPVARQARKTQDLAIARKLCQPDLDLAAFINKWYQQPVFCGINSHPHFPTLIAQRLQNSPLELARSITAAGLGSQPYLGEVLATNQLPLLLMVGENDRKFIAINQTMAASCPQAELLIVPNCSHNIHWQQPQLWVQAVQRWFS
jgi:2-succinyl-6-hydroxy-2,4-cyclohexadiene-1-carboxylate synthase